VGKEPEKKKTYSSVVDFSEEDDLTQEIQVDMESEKHYEYPEDQEIADAEDYCIEYEEDDTEEEKVEEEIEDEVFCIYPVNTKLN